MTEQEKFEAWYVKEYGCHPSKHNDARDHALLDCWQAAIASREPMQWQPIETAPKDDDALILVANSEGTWVAQYRPVYQSGFVPNCPWSSMLMNHDHIRFQKSFRPTHWMPLPSPPKD